MILVDDCDEHFHMDHSSCGSTFFTAHLEFIKTECGWREGACFISVRYVE